MAKIAFTGSFDSPHVGHMYVVDQARRMGFDVGEVTTQTYLNSINEEFFTPLMHDVWVNGELVVDMTLDEVRANSNK